MFCVRLFMLVPSDLFFHFFYIVFVTIKKEVICILLATELQAFAA
uniref:Uncharacterized protein n=1 Tax=Arundo donax TaxID=35708 RepID=A0A0A9B7F7_ARUDO